MPTGFALNRPRLQLTGLEEPEELWDRLKEATAEAQALAAANKKLTARVRVLERQLSEAGSLTDDELVAELPKRMSRALESAQGVAQEIVQRARNNEATIRQKATEEATAIVRRAEAEAAKIMDRTAMETAAHVAKAQADALDIVAAAQRRRKEIAAELEDEAVALQQRIKVLRRDQGRLVHAYEVVERTLAEAKRALDLTEPSPAAETVELPAPQRTDPRAPGRRNGVKPAPLRSGVYDWSPPTMNAG